MKIYNTLTKTKEEFIPREPGKVYMYVCGPTTYNYIHIGNARPIVFFDTVRRYFEYKGFEVIYVQNFTDIDDKIINRALEEGISPIELGQKYIIEYFKDADRLGVKRATVHPKVTEHIPEIIEMVKGLIEKGYAYEVEGNVYFAVDSFSDYGKLSGRDLEELKAGARVEVDEKKKNPLDFALWKKAKPGEPYWESPWGPGRPGWHIECSAMSLKYLGENFDIHGGGADLVFPHHENEVAQSEAFTGKPFARYWMHNGFITVNQEKMSKSLGNFFLVREILEKFPGRVVRFFLLSTHYRSPLDFDDKKLNEAKAALERVDNFVQNLKEVNPLPGEARIEIQEKITNFLRDFNEAMEDDFNTAQAMASLFELVRFGNTQIASGNLTAGDKKLFEEALNVYTQVFGIEFGVLEKIAGEDITPFVELLIEVRARLKKEKKYDLADFIRDELKKQGIILEDTPKGVRWKRV
ncbi:cysteine--tRNA ligase [Carboxydothermus hydrogenoformans]|uniref:Cysteine--tRNA ligase n=1 Tax=Carboxydothermus hydrogenoformans (strain ATCC BAA-161 / DSM 6008 / Z-2901) TaxID=246194 RepID=SYC_CARHZ|nr:cysteine--tRNA ligase [Carboxydothermus hydrogenoformans]Q3A9P1.1 RecName: Full=Cysteine--tRNA ligase; AltName: Full=Cysteinyl-tRNA synthetase; Short=CysRS [Carboxydothermus hydrogenoformans Z-2901]ABB15943.1 cysteinyl-tRNA synthetase [Carboxydothermus hydrogenoformans Z-2901]